MKRLLRLLVITLVVLIVYANFGATVGYLVDDAMDANGQTFAQKVLAKPFEFSFRITGRDIQDWAWMILWPFFALYVVGYWIIWLTAGGIVKLVGPMWTVGLIAFTILALTFNAIWRKNRPSTTPTTPAT